MSTANTAHHGAYVTQHDAESVIESVELAVRAALESAGERAMLTTLRVEVHHHPDDKAPKGFYVEVTASVERVPDGFLLWGDGR